MPLAPVPWLIATEVPGINPVSVIVLQVPPVVGPEVRLTEETVGATTAELPASIGLSLPAKAAGSAVWRVDGAHADEIACAAGSA
jgi:hypothetical protein